LRNTALHTLEGEVGPLLQQQRNSGAARNSEQQQLHRPSATTSAPPSKRRKLAESTHSGVDDLASEYRAPAAAASSSALSALPPSSRTHQQQQHTPSTGVRSATREEAVLAARQVNREDVTLDESSVLGCGAYASVCYGTFKGAPVAVKRFRSHVPDDEFEKELRIVSRLNHPHVVGCMGFFKHGQDRWILLEWAERGSLFDVLHPDDRYSLAARGPLSWRRKVIMAHDIADAMTFIHQSKYRHCDLNSKNLLVTRDFRVKVADLGLSHQVAEDGSSQLMDRRIGTLRWMAPEMLAKSCKSMEKADMYSFGVVLYELGSEQIPYHDKLDDDVRRLILRNVSPVLGADAHSWRHMPGYRDLINACLHQDPSQRPDFPTISATLSGILADMSAPAN
jgi:tRNA A-37 threonylcarbamoyl transferase component Bud32